MRFSVFLVQLKYSYFIYSKAGCLCHIFLGIFFILVLSTFFSTQIWGNFRPLTEVPGLETLEYFLYRFWPLPQKCSIFLSSGWASTFRII